ncbi:hypothetical protein B0T17DRAFT_509067 [Bombardia bombarda]|uniref:Uncharacterized protein n=1 Tax=Bombardia bombarda TaxID=252184 RepID=A0AA39WUC8_9PEZI|nr:hypothetical protein B0T17DRAFT_509067 [Bombardia bombarda]
MVHQMRQDTKLKVREPAHQPDHLTNTISTYVGEIIVWGISACSRHGVIRDGCCRCPHRYVTCKHTDLTPRTWRLQTLYSDKCGGKLFTETLVVYAQQLRQRQQTVHRRRHLMYNANVSPHPTKALADGATNTCTKLRFVVHSICVHSGKPGQSRMYSTIMVRVQRHTARNMQHRKTGRYVHNWRQLLVTPLLPPPSSFLISGMSTHRAIPPRGPPPPVGRPGSQPVRWACNYQRCLRKGTSPHPASLIQKLGSSVMRDQYDLSKVCGRAATESIKTGPPPFRPAIPIHQQHNKQQHTTIP